MTRLYEFVINIHNVLFYTHLKVFCCCCWPWGCLATLYPFCQSVRYFEVNGDMNFGWKVWPGLVTVCWFGYRLCSTSAWWNVYEYLLWHLIYVGRWHSFYENNLQECLTSLRHLIVADLLQPFLLCTILWRKQDLEEDRDPKRKGTFSECT